MSDAILAKLDKCKAYLSECVTAKDAKEVIDLAEAARIYAKRKGAGIEVCNEAAEYRVRAERRLGEILKQSAVSKGRPSKMSSTATFLPEGISRDESSKAQALADVPEDVFEKAIETGRKKELSPTKIGKDAQKLKRAKAQKAAEEDRSTECNIGYTLTADTAEGPNAKTVPCDAVITDPPYGILDEEWEPSDLKNFTLRWLRTWAASKAHCIVSFWSQRYLYEGRQWFDEALKGYDYEYQQTLIWHYPNNKSPQSRKGFKQTWEPIFFYRHKASDFKISVGGGEWGNDLNDFDCHVAAVPQSNFNGAETKVHPAQKPVSVMRWLINATTDPGHLVVDPFTGSGTTGIAALQLSRRFHGCEKDDGYREIAEKRIKAYAEME